MTPLVPLGLILISTSCHPFISTYFFIITDRLLTRQEITKETNLKGPNPNVRFPSTCNFKDSCTID